MPDHHCRYRAEAFHVGNPMGERNTWRVVALTTIMMIVEIAAGQWYGSMALLADGWHMSTHVAALGITAVAYFLARRHAADPRFAFGTWKIEVLGGFAGGMVLGMVGLWMIFESVERLFSPIVVHYDEALVVTAIGLAVNLACAALLAAGGHSHQHDHAHHGTCKHDHGANDLNLRAALAHVLTDALTSVLALVALAGGKFFGWGRLDPVMGIVGGVIVGVWALGLVRETGRVLLDREMDHPIVGEIRAKLEADGDTRVTDLHVWRVGYQQFAGVVTVAGTNPKSPAEYREVLSVHGELVHLTIEVSADGAVSAS